MEAEILIALAAAVNRAVELFKQALTKTEFSADVKRLLTLAFQVSAGVLVVLFAGDGINILADGGLHVPPIVGTIVTGALVGLGSEAIYVVLDILKRLRREEPQG